MKSSSIAQVFALLAASAAALPQAPGANLPSYPPGTGENLHEYPPGTGENLPFYPTPPGGYGNAGAAPPAAAPPAVCPPTDGPFTFTSTYHVVATPDQVVNGTANVRTGGLAGATGFYDFGINAGLDLICYNIRLVGFRGNYMSPAATATHVHEGLSGRSGPPRIVFPNPVGDDNLRISVGCLTGPFTTGVVTNGSDTGTGFKVAQIEANPSGFFADVHSSLAVPGAVRGQLS